jgi:hypothetical protein
VLRLVIVRDQPSQSRSHLPSLVLTSMAWGFILSHLESGSIKLVSAQFSDFFEKPEKTTSRAFLSAIGKSAILTCVYNCVSL